MARLPREQPGEDGDEEEVADEEFDEALSTPTTWYEPLSSLAPPPADEKGQQQQQQEKDEQKGITIHQKENEKEKGKGCEIKGRPVRVYADGIYDLFHFGHARALEQAKKLFPNTYLLVGCCSDEITHMYKGRTVMTEDERYESLRHCKWVDEVIPDAPWVLNQEFIDEHNIDYVAHDALPYADASGAGNDVYEFVKAIGKFKETKRTSGVSTSDIIMRILKDYNEYVMRNLARGYSRKDLGVSYVKEKQLRVNMGINKIREKVKEHQENVGKKLHTVAKTAGMHHSEWVENADRWVAGFLEKFEEGCHIMETAIKDKIQEGLKRQQSKSMNSLLEDAEAPTYDREF